MVIVGNLFVIAIQNYSLLFHWDCQSTVSQHQGNLNESKNKIEHQNPKLYPSHNCVTWTRGHLTNCISNGWCSWYWIYTQKYICRVIPLNRADITDTPLNIRAIWSKIIFLQVILIWMINVYSKIKCHPPIHVFYVIANEGNEFEQKHQAKIQTKLRQNPFCVKRWFNLIIESIFKYHVIPLIPLNCFPFIS